MPASVSTVITGAIGFVSIGFGTLFSAFLLNRLGISQSASKCTLLALTFYLVSSFCFLILLNYCPEDRFPNGNDQNNCMSCDCGNKFNPVCLRAGNVLTIYKSPCHAGCTSQTGDNVFTDCQCVANVSRSFNLSGSYCDEAIKCTGKLAANGVAALLIVLFTAMAIVPHLKAELACVSKSEQAFVLAMQAALVALLGNFVGTVLVGRALDLTCIHWQSNEYGQRVCKLYDNRLMSLALAMIGFGCRFATTAFLFVSVMIFLCRESKHKLSSTSPNSTGIRNPNQIELQTSS